MFTRSEGNERVETVGECREKKLGRYYEGKDGGGVHCRDESRGKGFRG